MQYIIYCCLHQLLSYQSVKLLSYHAIYPILLSSPAPISYHAVYHILLSSPAAKLPISQAPKLPCNISYTVVFTSSYKLPCRYPSTTQGKMLPCICRHNESPRYRVKIRSGGNRGREVTSRSEQHTAGPAQPHGQKRPLEPNQVADIKQPEDLKQLEARMRAELAIKKQEAAAAKKRGDAVAGVLASVNKAKGAVEELLQDHSSKLPPYLVDSPTSKRVLICSHFDKNNVPKFMAGGGL